MDKELIKEEDRGTHIYRKERWRVVGEEWTIMESAYSKQDGGYIGTIDSIKGHLDRGIVAFEKTSPDHDVCSIGWNEEEQKWYGWSHRAIAGFGIASTCKMGDSHFTPSNSTEFLADLRSFHATDEEGGVVPTEIKLVRQADGTRGALVRREGSALSTFEPFPKPWGKGEWVAKTLEEAKQMAMDFAESVS